ncbi:PucR family transcriptional regulator [Prauserella cavernicola]|uniref:Helix-turn-helix domain-containing protein n=1 Tax=Prauserella cavernicola TaxID=2800127 RepID=A0A934QWZ4_9PSEU|nr:helix-turn-helix domain-containing protein [Prauserella cavernicola]MBK1787697.1 helix-turn-helix domain-containing protein [Prauserella cavernicola]
MRYTGAEPEVAELAARVWSRLPELTRTTYELILDDMPVYREQRFVTHEQLLASCRDNLQFLVRSLQETGAPDLSKARATGRQRALLGAPLPELLTAFRIGFTGVWRCCVELTAPAQDLATLVSVTTSIWTLMDDYLEELTTTYRETMAEISRTQQNRRLALVEALFAGRTATEGTLWDIARMLDLPLDGTFVVVAAETPGLGQESLPLIEHRLLRQHHASAWRLTPELQVGVVSLREPEPVLALLREQPRGRVGVSPVFTGLGETARALHLARVALSSVDPGAREVVQFHESPLAGLVASDPEASAQLAGQVLRPILELPGEESNVLLLTLRAWFESQGSTKLTAERVFCHPNTVRHRLKRITDVLGRSLGDPADIAELGTALRALAMFGESTRRAVRGG